MTQANVLTPAAVGIGLGVVGRAFDLKGAAKTVTGIGGLAGLGLAVVNAARNYKAAAAPAAAPGAAAAPRTGRAVTEIAAKAPAEKTDTEKRVVLTAYSCYENARRAAKKESWWRRLSGTTIRQPLRDCGLTPSELAMLKSEFAKIPPAERVRLLPGPFKVGGSLEDLGARA